METLGRKEIGIIGEEIASRFLAAKGYKILDRNYRKKWGEIDIVAEEAGKLIFCEVKSVSCVTVNHETKNPEENIHSFKMKRLYRTIQSYLLENKVEKEWRFDTLAVFVSTEEKKAKVRHMKDVVLE